MRKFIKTHKHSVGVAWEFLKSNPEKTTVISLAISSVAIAISTIAILIMKR